MIASFCCRDPVLDKSDLKLECEFYKAKGAVDILDILREEMEQWLEEAQDDTKHEALENVLGHIEVLGVEYRKRYMKLNARLDSGS